MKIGILQAGRTPEELRAVHGDYDDLYARFLSGRGFDFKSWPVLEGRFPRDVHEVDGWLVSGSRFSAYDDLDWIGPLEDFLRRAYRAGVPIVGVCFGHQILAQALGGRVEKYEGGWAVGPVSYHLDINDKPVNLLAWHQDQVVELPPGARVSGWSDDCRYAMLSYGDRALSIQPHPEFTDGFVADLIAARRDVLPAGVAARGLAALGAETSSSLIADQFEKFFVSNRGE